MPIELRIQRGARAGSSQSFEKSVIAIGRHPLSDLRFDANRDLDVSARHAEIRAVDGRYAIHDLTSTNGTYVNGTRVPPGGSAALADQDVIAFGLEGPTVLVGIGTESTAPPPPTVRHFQTMTMDADAPAGSGSTTQRVAAAVRQQTRGLRVGLAAAVIGLSALAVGIFYKGTRDAAARDRQIQSLLAANEQVNQELRVRLQGDTALANELARHTDSLARVVRQARSAAQTAEAALALMRSRDLQRQAAEMELPAVREANDPAVALVSTRIGDQRYEATGFAVSATGLLVTNRHVVSDSTGAHASEIVVKFANSRRWRRAHLLKLADDSSVDLALLQIDDAGAPVPMVHAIASSVDIPVGSSIATLGFPLGTDLPMEGSGSDQAAKTSLTIGTVSKRVPGLLQIDAFASHGSSGSPVFDAHGHVIGVVWGGPTDGGGRIVFAVPAEELRRLVPPR